MIGAMPCVRAFLAAVPWSELSDVVVALAAAFAALVAWRGLRTWREEVRGRTDYDLARRTLVLVYRVREGVRLVRNPFMHGYESAERERGEHESPDQANRLNEAFAYERRWKSVSEAMVELEAALLEAETHWENLLTSAANALRVQVNILYVSLGRFLRVRGGEERDIPNESFLKLEKVIYPEFSPDGADKFQDDFEAAIAMFQAPLREKLRP